MDVGEFTTGSTGAVDQEPTWQEECRGHEYSPMKRPRLLLAPIILMAILGSYIPSTSKFNLSYMYPPQILSSTSIMCITYELSYCIYPFLSPLLPGK